MALAERTDMLCCSCDLDLDPITLIYELDLDILKKKLHTKNKVSRWRFSKARARTGRTHTDRCDRAHYHATFGDGNNNNDNI